MAEEEVTQENITDFIDDILRATDKKVKVEAAKKKHFPSLERFKEVMFDFKQAVLEEFKTKFDEEREEKTVNQVINRKEGIKVDKERMVNWLQSKMKHLAQLPEPNIK